MRHLCLIIRHINNKLHPILHRDGKGLFAGERRKARKQPVSVCLLLYFDQVIVSERYITHIADRKCLVEIRLIKAKNLRQFTQIDTAFTGHGECVSVVREVNCVDDTVYRE